MDDEVPLRWGVLGVGYIAPQFARGVSLSRSGTLAGVASRNAGRAAELARAHGAPKHFGSYLELLDDDEIDAVYIALPNHLHVEWTERSALAGKHVLCEKPIALNAAEAAHAAAVARESGVTLMEGFMYRAHPQITEMTRLLSKGEIGNVRVMECSFGGNMRGGDKNYRMQREAGGGALMDLGCYGVSLSRLVAGIGSGASFADPINVTGIARIGQTSGVDEWGVGLLEFESGLISTVTCGNQVDIASVARLWGTEGSITLRNPWQPEIDGRAPELVIEHRGAMESRILPADRPIYALEVDAFAEYVRTGVTRAPVMDLEDSLGNMRVLDDWRRAIGLRFPTEGT
ncbi:Gfo/Idh/MocA family protein [Humibacter albus]|uniref:Gfo/Idh/MocA family protein n=1 Tax=Humibacter albus TaxID=427754 RepID=UPI0003B3D1A2|nr:Gfo/Idh/MocA family oxidoreductase [Humibacter albus]